MNCEMARNLMQDELDGLLPVERSEALRAHLSSCASCAAEFKALRAIDAVLASDPLVRAPSALPGAVMAEVAHRAGSAGLLERFAVWVGVPVGLLSAGLGVRAILVESGAASRAAHLVTGLTGGAGSLLTGITKTPELASPGVQGVVLALAAVVLSFLAITALRMYKHQPIEWI